MSTAAVTAEPAADRAAEPVAVARMAGGASVAELPLLISGMDCAACAAPIAQALRAVPGVVSADVQADSHRASVVYDPRQAAPAELIAAVESAGYGAAPDTLEQARRQRREENRQGLWRLFVAGFLAMQVMMLATPAYVAPPGDLSPEFKRLLDIASAVLTLPVLVFGAGAWFGAAWRALRRGRVVMELPVCVGLAAAFVASCAAAWAPGGWAGHEVYFDSIGMFVAVLLAARWWEARARHRAAEVLEATLAARPDTAERESADGRVQTVALAQIVPGDVLRVALGAAFPADGRLLEGATRCDEALLTGESMPVAKVAGDDLVAGSLNVGHPVRMRVERIGADTRLAGIEALVRGALTQRPASAALADAWAAPFLATVLVLAALGGLAWSYIEPARAVWVAVSVLIVTCPCALAISVPSTLLAATRGLARQGVLVRRLEALARLATVNEVVFDKTGTLSRDSLALADVRLEPGAAALGIRTPSHALARAAELAGWSQHPRSKALVRAARESGVAAPADGAAAGAGEAFDEVAGFGVQARDSQGRLWRLGGRSWALQGASLLSQAHAEGAASELLLSCDAEPVARFELHEELRAGAVRAVESLEREGVTPRLLSGDRAEATRALAARVRIAHWRAGATAADKLDEVASLQRTGRVVAMVGDGINDAPVLARADVAFAMGHAALAAREHADFVLLADRPGDVAIALATSRRTLRLVRQNMLWSAAYNATCIPLALVGWLPPWAAGIGMALSSVLVVANAQRAARQPASPDGPPGPTPDMSDSRRGGPEWKASTC